MRPLNILIKSLLLLALIFFIGGMMISEEWTVSRSISIQASPQQIYPFISRFSEWENWSPWNASKDPSLKYTYEGPAAGAGAKQNWTSDKMGTGWMKLTSANPNKGITYDLFIDMHDHASTLQGSILFSPQDAVHTLVTWTDKGNAGNSYFKKWLSLLIQPMLKREIEKGLAGLKTAAEKK